MPESEPMISAKGIWKIFGANAKSVFETHDRTLTREQVKEQTGHVVGVKDVSFQVARGECFVVMGLSGSGKSTLLRTLTRLIEPTGGDIHISGVDVCALNKPDLTQLRRTKVAMVFQHFGLFPHRTVLDNTAFGLEVRGTPSKARMEKSREILDLVGLDGWGDCYPRELSGGMQQRVGLARAMAMDTEILFFDEPFSALDPLIRREMQDELLDLQKKLQKTMVFITHDFMEAVKMGDAIAIMKDGEVVQMDSPEQIIAKPVNDYVRDFAEDVPRYKVLSAGSVMRPARAGLSAAQDLVVKESAKIDSLISMAADTDQPFAVVNQVGALVGEIDRSIIMKAMDSG